MIKIETINDCIIVSDDIGFEMSIRNDGSNFNEKLLLSFLKSQTDRKRIVMIESASSTDSDQQYRMELIKYMIESFLEGFYQDTNISEGSPIENALKETTNKNLVISKEVVSDQKQECVPPVEKSKVDVMSKRLL